MYSIEKELLMIYRYADALRKESLSYETLKFKIFKLSFDKCEWIEKETLGDVALFVGDNSSISILASNLPRCMRNCIYFNHDFDRVTVGSKPIADFGIYNVESQTISKPSEKPQFPEIQVY